MNKKVCFFSMVLLIILMSCSVYGKYILTSDFSLNITSLPFIFDASLEKNTFVMDTVGVDINFSVKNFDENNNYNDYDVEYQVSLEDNSKFDFELTARSVSTKTLTGGAAAEEDVSLRLIPNDVSSLNSKENITLKITTLTPYKKEIELPITINTNPYTLSGIELNYLIKNGSYAPEGDVYDYYAVDANRLQDYTVTKIVFGKRSDYTSTVSGITAEPIDANRIGVVNLYRKPNSDASTYTIYILSEDGTFELSENAAWTFDKLYALESIVNLHLVDTSEVTNMRDMFCDCAALKTVDLSNFKTDKVTDMIGMFARMYAIKYLDLTTFDTSSISVINQFLSATTVERIYISDSFSIPSGAVSTGMFSNCTNIIGQNGTVYDSTKVTATMAVVDGTTEGYLCGMYEFTDGANTNNIIKGKTQAERDAWTISSRYMDKTISEITFGKTRDYYATLCDYTPSGVDTFESGAISSYRIAKSDGTYHVYILSNTGTFIANSNASFMFDGLACLENINNLNLLNTSKTTQMRDMFCDAQSIASLDLSNFNTSNVTTLEGMFARMYTIQTLDLSSFNTSKVTTILNTFVHSINSGYTIDKFLSATPALTTIYVSDSWTTSALTSSTQGAFSNNINLVGGAGTTFSTSNISAVYARIDTESTPGYFTSK